MSVISKILTHVLIRKQQANWLTSEEEKAKMKKAAETEVMGSKL